MTPRYVGNSFIARHLGVHHTTVIRWREHYPPGHPQVPTPVPAAVVVERFGSELPLWEFDQLGEWEAWREVFLEYARVNNLVRLGMARRARAGAGR